LDSFQSYPGQTRLQTHILPEACHSNVSGAFSLPGETVGEPKRQQSGGQEFELYGANSTLVPTPTPSVLHLRGLLLRLLPTLSSFSTLCLLSKSWNLLMILRLWGHRLRGSLLWLKCMTRFIRTYCYPFF
jgi:hypothetical protein